MMSSNNIWTQLGSQLMNEAEDTVFENLSSAMVAKLREELWRDDSLDLRGDLDQAIYWDWISNERPV